MGIRPVPDIQCRPIVLATDPNWFYSTLAQSTAAIAGLAAAFLLQQLLVLRSQIAPERERIRQKALELVDEIRSFALELQEVAVSFATAADEWRTRERAGEGTRITITQFQFLKPEHPPAESWGPVDTPAVLESVAQDLGTLAESSIRIDEKKVFHDLRTFRNKPMGFPTWPGLPPGAPPARMVMPRPKSGWPEIEDQKAIASERWEEVGNKAIECGQDLAVLQSRLAPPSLYLLFVTLVGMLGAGVVAPLFFLSAEPGSSKCWLLGAFIVLAAGFVLFYGWELSRLRMADRLERSL